MGDNPMVIIQDGKLFASFQTRTLIQIIYTFWNAYNDKNRANKGEILGSSVSDLLIVKETRNLVPEGIFLIYFFETIYSMFVEGLKAGSRQGKLPSPFINIINKRLTNEQTCRSEFRDARVFCTNADNVV